MQIPFVRIAFVLVALTLASCGGGGGGGDSGGNTNAVFTLDTASVDFSGDAASNVAPQTEVTGSVTGATQSVIVNVIIQTPGIIENAFMTISGTTGTLTIIGKRPNELGVGLYTGTLTVQVCNDAACTQHLTGSPRTIAINYEVTPTTFVLEPAAIEISGVHRQSASATANLSISDGPDDWTSTIDYTDGQGWLSVDPESQNSLPASLSFQATSLPPGTYSATVTFETLTGNTSLPVPITYNVAPADLNVAEESVTFDIDSTSIPGDLVRSIAIGSGSGNRVDWQADVDTDWISLAPTSGNTVDVGALEVRVNESLANLVNGTYSATLTLSSTDPSINPVAIPIELNKATRAARFVAPHAIVEGDTSELIVRGEGFTNVQAGDVELDGAPISAFTIVNDTELRFDPTVLAVGSYPVSIRNDLGIELNTAAFVVTDPPQFTAETVSVPPGFVGRLVYDPARNNLYSIAGSAQGVVRFQHDGAAWQSDVVTLPLVANQFIYAGRLSADGNQLILQVRRDFTGYLEFIDLDTFTVIEDPPGGALVDPADRSFMLPVNNGDVLLNQTFLYSTLTKSTAPLGGEVLEYRGDWTNSNVAASVDGSIAYLLQDDFNNPGFYVYNSSDGTIATLPGSFSSNWTTTDRSGSVVAFDGDIYDRNATNLLGTTTTLPVLNRFSRDGTSVYYIDPTTDLFIGKDVQSPNGSGGFTELFPPIAIPGDVYDFVLDARSRTAFLLGDNLYILPLP